MTNEKKMSTSRLLEAFDCIDDSFIAHAALCKFKQAEFSSEPDKKNGWLSLRCFTALAVCLALISVIIPVAHYVAVNMNAFIPGAYWAGPQKELLMIYHQNAVSKTIRKTKQTAPIRLRYHRNLSRSVLLLMKFER